MRDAVADLRDPHGRSVPIRMGIGSGSVVAGRIGMGKFFCDVWGDAVNVTAGTELPGAGGTMQVSHETYKHLKDDLGLKAMADRRPGQRQNTDVVFDRPESIGGGYARRSGYTELRQSSND